MTTRKNIRNEDDKSANNVLDKPSDTKLEIDPNTGLVENVFDDAIDVDKQLFKKNPRRVRALKDLWYDELQNALANSDGSEEAKREMIFMMIANNILDIILGCVPDETALEVSYALDNTIALSHVNKKYDCDLIEEERKAISIVKREDYDTDDDFSRALESIEDHWWSIGQPQLGMRSANDAIIEMLRKYELNE
ncbi:MAG: hypothetical protein MJZ03_01035 [archaeon]|nr:hypothetical protein [archaeon]